MIENMFLMEDNRIQEEIRENRPRKKTTAKNEGNNSHQLGYTAI